MPFSETNRPSDSHSKHTDNRTRPAPLDLLRLIASQQSKETLSVPSSAQDKGKRPASQEEDERLVGEDGKPLEKLQMVPEREFLLGGMWNFWRRGDQASTSGRMRAEDLARMSPDELVDWSVRGGLREAIGPDGDRTFVPVVMDMLETDRIDDLVRRGIEGGIGAVQPESDVINQMMRRLETDRIDDLVYRSMANEIGELVRKTIEDRSHIRRDVNNEIDCTPNVVNNAPTLSSREASSSRRAGESRSPERVRSGEGSSAQGEQLIDQMKKILEEHSLMRERENKLKQEAEQRLQRELERVRREEQQKLLQERDRFQRQLGDAREERDQARGQLREAQQERDQARRQLREAEETRQSLQGKENRRWVMWNRLYDTFWSLVGNTEREPRQDERGQSSRGDLRVNDALPTTREGTQEQLERERRAQQESRERVQRLREHIQRIIWEQGNEPLNERLNELLKYPIEGVLEDHQLVEKIYPLNDQPAKDRQAFSQSLNKALRKRLKDIYLTIRAEYALSGLGVNEIAVEFLGQLEEQIKEHDRPNQEWIDASEDIQQEVTGRRPNRTQH
jgi:hypothetical protein